MKWIQAFGEGLHCDRISENGRWRILNPSGSPSKRWELYDVPIDGWEGDHPTLKAAQACAEVLAREGRRR